MSSAPVLQQQRFLLPGDIASTLVSLSQSYGFGTLTRESGLQEALWLALPNWDIGDTDSGVLQLADIELYGDTRLASYLPLSQEGEAQTLSSFFGSGSRLLPPLLDGLVNALEPSLPCLFLSLPL